MRNRMTIGLILALVAALLSLTPVLAQTGGTNYIVQPGDSLYKIAQRYGTTVDAIVDVNDLANPNLIFVGQLLVIPGTAPAAPSTGTTAGSTATIPPGGILVGGGNGDPGIGVILPSTVLPADPSAWGVTVGAPIYSGDGYVIDIPVTVTNFNVTPEIAGGKYTSTLKPDGRYEDAALIKARHGTFEEPLVNNALMWQATVHMSDGSTHFMTAGCLYRSSVFAEGDEPLSRDAEGRWLEVFHYEIFLFDGWFDCGNTLRVNPPNILPGQSGTSVFKVYMVNPFQREVFGRIVGSPYPTRRVTQLDVTVFRQDGSVVGTKIVAVP